MKPATEQDSRDFSHVTSTKKRRYKLSDDLIYAKKLEEHGIRPSVQRTAIYRYISENKVHPTADTVYMALSPEYPTLSKTTVYNTLHLFSQKNLVRSVMIESDEIRYDADTSDHIHFKCTKCQKVFDIFNKDFFTQIEENKIQTVPAGFTVKKIEFNVWGICTECGSDCKK